MNWRTASWAALTVAALALAAACSASEALPSAEDPSAISIDGAPGEVVLQLGSYNIGENIDGFVTGPDLVVYGDGSAYRDTFRAPNDAADRLERAQISEPRLVDIVAVGRELPGTVDGQPCGEDEPETRLVVEARTWSACGLLDAPEFGSFLDAVQAEVDSLQPSEWKPAAFIEHEPRVARCAVVDQSTLPAAQHAPVYPHVAGRFPLGALECPWATP